MSFKVDKTLREANKKLQNILTKERFIDRIEKMIKEGTVKIVGCEDDGTPIVNITKKGMRTFTNVLGDA